MEDDAARQDRTGVQEARAVDDFQSEFQARGDPVTDNSIFVFGSNLAGRHGAGAARHALAAWGAIYGQGEGLQGQSYAIPTKDMQIQTLSLEDIEGRVATFCEFALSRPDLTFELTAIGCGLAGYKPHQIAPMFRVAPGNVRLPVVFVEVLR